MNCLICSIESIFSDKVTNTRLSVRGASLRCHIAMILCAGLL
ncbi:hypothetical protein HMPREF3207_01301 [Citrobacter koseri]|nr:hypothetical protein HMPREF3207_01301 [Citrobacter koseri]